MAMSRKDYEKLAGILSRAGLDKGVLLAIADCLAEDNPRFDKDRFVRAATPVWTRG